MEEQVLDTACVYVALVIQYAMRTPHIILSCVARLALPHFFYIIPQTAIFYEQKKILK